MSRIVLVRHGETEWHIDNRYVGSSDVATTARGLQQAHALAGWAADAGLMGLYVSPQTRAQATMQPVAAALQLSPITDHRLREIHFGDGEGLTAREMQARFPASYEAFRQDPYNHPLPNGESPQRALARARAALTDINAAWASDDRILVVTHNTLIRLLLCELLGLDPSLYRQIFPVQDNVSITEIQLSPTATALLHFNAPISCNNAKP